jgi:hypothetical protein
VGSNREHRVNPGLPGSLLHVGEKLGSLWEFEVEAHPEFFGGASAGDPRSISWQV